MKELPPGFRFYPMEEELVSFYLHHKLQGTRPDLNWVMDRIIPVLDIYQFNPWDLPQLAGDECNNPEEWFFFIPRQESEARGGRPRRLTTSGYWKATGSPGPVYSNSRSIGIKRTMVFYTGRAPSGKKTEWKMNEYKAIQADDSSSSTTTTASPLPKLRHEFSLCRVYKKSKIMRAFDRRPMGLEGGPENTTLLGQPSSSSSHQIGNVAANVITSSNIDGSHQNPPPLLERTLASSPESSSSGDHGGSGNVPISTDDVNFWDWGHLDWTYDEEEKL